MRILLLATDESPKLAPLTEQTAGPLITVVNRPLIGIALEQLAQAGYKNALVSLYNRNGNIASYLNTGRRWGMNLEYLNQREPLGDAGSIRWAGNLFNETCLVLPADTILDLDITAALAFHRAHGGPATVIAARRAGAAHGALQTNGDKLIGLGNSESTVFATGAYLFEPSVLDAIPSHIAYDCYSQLLPALVGAGKSVHVFETTAYWNPLERFADYREAQRVYLLNAFYRNDAEKLAELAIPQIRYPSIEGREIAPGIWVGINDVIHPTVSIAAPVCIGDNCWIGRDTEIGPEVVIGTDAVIDDEATVEYSTVNGRTYVGRLLKMSGMIADSSTLIDMESGVSTAIVDSFLLSSVGAESSDGRLRRPVNVLAALLLIVLLLPVILVLGLLSLIIHRRVLRPVTRMGSLPPTWQRRQENGPHPFTLFRFATTSEGQPPSAYGRWLLRSGIASLPGLFNVLRGDCELIGVKPLRPEEAAAISEDWQLKHYERPAGLSGAWYVQAPLGSSLDEFLVVDAYYVATRTLGGDILLIWQTLVTWVRRQLTPSGTTERELISDLG